MCDFLVIASLANSDAFTLFHFDAVPQDSFKERLLLEAIPFLGAFLAAIFVASATVVAAILAFKRDKDRHLADARVDAARSIVETVLLIHQNEMEYHWDRLGMSSDELSWDEFRKRSSAENVELIRIKTLIDAYFEEVLPEYKNWATAQTKLSILHSNFLAARDQTKKGAHPDVLKKCKDVVQASRESSGKLYEDFSNEQPKLLNALSRLIASAMRVKRGRKSVRMGSGDSG